MTPTVKIVDRRQVATSRQHAQERGGERKEMLTHFTSQTVKIQGVCRQYGVGGTRRGGLLLLLLVEQVDEVH